MRIYVGNLPYNATDEDLWSLFEVHGKVTSANIVIDRASGQSKGFGFVEMPAAAEAQLALTELNGKDFKGRPLTVSEARPREERGGGGGGGGGRGGGGYGRR
ncbi:MAG: RNA recognition motif domain-containing protein [Anaerolineae bacterium]